MTDRQLALLRQLVSDGGWLRPMDLGARDQSHHTTTLKQLIAKGYAERKLRGSLLNDLRGPALYRQLANIKRQRTHPRGSYVYRVTDAGRARAASQEES